MSADLPEAAITAAAEALWQSGACEPQEAAALARIALTAALPALTGAITAQATTTERERIRQLAVEHNALVFVYNASQITGEPGWYTPHPFAGLLGGAADGAHTPGGAA